MVGDEFDPPLEGAVFRDIAEEIRTSGWIEGPVSATIVAQMLALLASADEKLRKVRETFLAPDAELASFFWDHHLSEMEGAFGISLKARPPQGSYPPGLVDKLRRHLLSLPSVREGRAASPSIRHRVLTLAGGRHAEWPLLSREIEVFLADAFAIREDERVFCTSIGMTGAALHLAAERGAQVLLDVPSPDAARLAIWLARAAGTEIDVHIGGQLVHRSRRALSRPFGDGEFDVALLSLPWGMRQDEHRAGTLTGRPGQALGSAEAAHVVEAARRGRRAACLVPGAYLFRTTGAEQIAKKEAIFRYGLDAVVALPRDALGRHTSIPVSFVLLKSAPDDDRRHVLMVGLRGDAEAGRDWVSTAARAVRQRETGDMSILVPVEDLEAQDLNLSVDRYVLSTDGRRAREWLAQSDTHLEDLAELYRPQALLTSTSGRNRRDEPAGNVAEEVDGERIIEVGVVDIDEAGLVREPRKVVQATPEVVQRSRKARLEPGDILIVNKGSVGKVAFIREVPDGQIWVASQSFVIARVRRSARISDPLVLFRFLSSDIGQAAIRSLSVGTTIPGIQMNDVRRLPVLLPSISQQKAIASGVRDVFATHDRIRDMREGATKRLQELWPDGGKTGARGAAA